MRLSVNLEGRFTGYKSSIIVIKLCIKWLWHLRGFVIWNTQGRQKLCFILTLIELTKFWWNAPSVYTYPHNFVTFWKNKRKKYFWLSNPGSFNPQPIGHGVLLRIFSGITKLPENSKLFCLFLYIYFLAENTHCLLII